MYQILFQNGDWLYDATTGAAGRDKARACSFARYADARYVASLFGRGARVVG